MKTLVAFILCCYTVTTCLAQADTLYDPIRVVYSDKFVADTKTDTARQYYTGNVKILHDSTYFFCDSAITFQNNLLAFEDVTILKADTIETYSDKLTYNGDISLATLEYNVVLVNGDERLFTERLLFNLDTDVASYTDTTLMISKTSKLSSLRGNYDLNRKIAHFYNQVTLVDSSFNLLTDTLIYNLNTSKAEFFGPSYIYQEDTKIYAEKGFYNTDAGDAYFEQNAKYNSETGVASADRMRYIPDQDKIILDGNAEVQDSNYYASADKIEYYNQDSIVILTGNALFQDEENVAKGQYIKIDQTTDEIEIIGDGYYANANNVLESDTIFYNSISKQGETIGNSIYTDTIEDRRLYADYLKYNPDGTYRAYNSSGRPYMEQINDDGDTTYLVADTLYSILVPPDSLRLDTTEYFIGYPDVKIYSESFQAVADSLVYALSDTTLTLFGDPMSWADTSQFEADTIIMKNQTSNKGDVDLYGKANVINYLDAQYQDQIKGKVIHAKLDSQKLKSLRVEGNAEVIYFVRDESGLYIGANKTICSLIDFWFVGGELEDIKFRGTPVSKMTPITQASESDVKLKQIAWDETRRPMSKDDAFAPSKRVAIAPKEKTKEDSLEKPKEVDIFEEETRKILDKQKRKQ